MNDKIKKRTTISLKTKIIILDQLAVGEKIVTIGKRFGLGESTIRAIKNNEDAIRHSNSFRTNGSGTTSSYLRNPLVEKTEKALLIWIEDATHNRIPLSGQLIKEKAKRFYNKLKSESSSSSIHSEKSSFFASTGWLTGFLKNHGFHNLKINGEVASAAENYPEVLLKIIKDGGYCSDQVFNADETGLFWKKMPSRTYIAKSPSGFKASKERVTFLFCSNASGDKMLKPLLVNKLLRPRALKGKDLKKLPVHWMANSKAWVTTAIFTAWFNECFVPEVEKYLIRKGLDFKVLLIIDNAPGHPHLSHPNVEIVFFPPNTKSLIQPLDQGIIATFKKYYVKFTFQFILEKMKVEDIELPEAWKKFTILNCINHAAAAIAELNPSTLNACWENAWIECVNNSNSTLQTSTLSLEIAILANEIGGEGLIFFGDNDLMEMMQDDVAMTDNEIIDHVEHHDKCEVEVESKPLTASVIREGLKLCSKLEKHFLVNDADSERALKFQRELKTCMANYRELYKELTKQPPQRLITDPLLEKKTPITEHDETVILQLSSDKSEFQPIQKKIRLSDCDIKIKMNV